MPGALISTMYAALRPEDGLKNLVLLTAPLDFTDKTAGGFIRWTSLLHRLAAASHREFRRDGRATARAGLRLHLH